HLLALAALRGVAVLVGDQRFALARDHLGAPPPPVDRDRALAELARRYLAAHAPATDADLAAWAGLPLRDARAGLRAIGGELVEGEGGVLDLAAREPRPDRLGPRLLPAFDPYLLGWKDRSFAVPAEHARRVHPGGGILRAVATIDGLVLGLWSDAMDDPAFRAEVDDVARFASPTGRLPP
ncbi:MAG TPA: crosslink repair DNA glycosylase YcaQ family protein, partial [Solirubrobacteraceae bacterium]